MLMLKLPVCAMVTSVVAMPSALVVAEELAKVMARPGLERHVTAALGTGTPTSSVTMIAMVELAEDLARLRSLMTGTPTTPSTLAGRVQTLNALPLPIRYRYGTRMQDPPPVKVTAAE